MKIKILLVAIVLAVVGYLGFAGLNKDKENPPIQNPVVQQKSEQKVESSKKSVSPFFSEQDGVIITQEGEVEEEKITSFDLIDTALKDEKITKIESIDLKLKTIFSPKALPEEYRSDQNTGEDRFHSIQFEIQWLYDHWDSLSQEEKDHFYKYLALPDDPESIHNTDIIDHDKNSFLEKLNFAAAAYAATPENTTFHGEIVRVISGKKIELWAQIPNDPVKKKEYMKKINAVKDALQYTFPKLKKYFGKDLKMDAIVSICKLPGFYGIANDLQKFIYKNGKERSTYYVRVAKRLDGKLLKATVAHELFHVFQFNSTTADTNTDDKTWIMETTAVWAEDFIYPTYDTEHEYTKKFFLNLNRINLFHVGGNFEYSRHLFIRFLAQYLNDDKIPKKLLDDVFSGQKLRDAIEKQMNNKNDAIAEYSLYNWNKSPYRKYTDLGSFPTFTLPHSMLSFLRRTKYKTAFRLPSTLQTLFVVYLDKDILKFPKIKFTFDAKTDVKPTIVGLFQTPKGWTKENLTKKAEKEIIRIDGENRLDKFVFLITNPDFKKDIQLEITVDTTLKENAILSVNNNTQIENELEDGNFINYYNSSYTGLMNVDLDPTSNSYYLKSINAVYKGSTRDNKNIIDKDSVGRINKDLSGQDKTYIIYNLGKDIICQLWPYIGENWVKKSNVVHTGNGIVPFEEEGIPLAPEILLHTLQFKPGDKEILLKQGPLNFKINYQKDKNSMGINIKYEGPGTNSMLDQTTNGITKGAIKYIHYFR